MKCLKFTIEDIIQSNFFEDLLQHDEQNVHCEVIFPDKKIKTTSRILIFNILVWIPYKDFNIVPKSEDYNEITKLTTKTIINIHSNMYIKMLHLLPNVYYMDIIKSMFESISTIDNYISMTCRSYASTIDIVGICKMRQDPKIKEIITTKLDTGEGTAVAEARFNSLSKQFLELISTRGAVENNVLYNFAITNNLNKNQLPQWFIAYGTRSDIDDSMVSNVIEESSISGLTTTEDFATEGLSVKKSSHSSKKVIKTTQYFNRKLKLSCLPMMKVYPGSCGNTSTVKIFLKGSYKQHFIDKVIYANGRKVILTPDVIDNYIDKHINMMSPIMCNHLDGFCESCAGMGEDMFSKFLPPDIHIGIFAASMMASAVSQMILSAKHLIRTFSMLFTLPVNARTLMTCRNDDIYLKIHPNDLNDLTVRIPLKDINPLSDLAHDDIPASSFSKVKEFNLMKGEAIVDTINLVEEEYYMLYFNNDFLNHIRDNIQNVIIDHGHVDIPLKGFNMRKKFITHVTHNNDMKRFTKRVFTFFGTHIGKYTSVSECLEDFIDILYDKSGIDILFVEIVLRCFLMKENNMVGIPLVTDLDNVHFGKMSHILSNGPISTKLSFQGLSKYFRTVDTYIEPKPVGMLDPIFDYRHVV